jgi:hypothetical protein
VSGEHFVVGGTVDAGQNRLVDRSRSSGAVVQVLFGTVFAGFAGVFVATSAFIQEGSASFGFPTGFGLIFTGVGLLFVAVGLAVLGRGLRQLWLRYLLGTPTLFVPSADILLGDTVTTRFERRGGSGRGRQGRREISASLISRETVTYRRGTDTETVNHDARRAPLQVTMDDHPQAVAGRIQVVIPADWPPTIALAHNKVQTVVEVLVHAPGLPEDRSNFPVLVRPAVRGGRPS